MIKMNLGSGSYPLQPLYFTMSTKEQFLIDHNKLSPVHLQTTMVMLSRFRTEKPSLFKDEGWPVDKLRRPFLLWLTSFSSAEAKHMAD